MKPETGVTETCPHCAGTGLLRNPDVDLTFPCYGCEGMGHRERVIYSPESAIPSATLGTLVTLTPEDLAAGVAKYGTERERREAEKLEYYRALAVKESDRADEAEALCAKLREERDCHWKSIQSMEGLQDDERARADEAEARAQRAEAALQKINHIRNSIVGAQAFNFSEHAYPLVAALNEAGIEGQPYPEARENLGTLMARAEKAEAALKLLGEDAAEWAQSHGWASPEVVAKVREHVAAAVSQLHNLPRSGSAHFAEEACSAALALLPAAPKVTP